MKVWFVYEGSESTRRSVKYVLPTRREIKYTLPLAACVKKLGLSEHQWIAPMNCGARLRDRVRRLEGLTAPRHVLCEVGEIEATAFGWKAGYYRVDASPGEVAKRLEAPFTLKSAASCRTG